MNIMDRVIEKMYRQDPHQKYRARGVEPMDAPDPINYTYSGVDWAHGKDQTVEVLPATPEQIEKGQQFMWETNTPEELHVLMEHLARRGERPAFLTRGWELPPLQCSNCIHLSGDDYKRLSTQCAQGYNMSLRHVDKCPKKEVL